MTEIYVIRHAEAEGNLYRIAQGQYDSILTERGWQQVRALERRFSNIAIDAAYSSDLYRACATASAICRPKGLELRRRRDLREICVGSWEQKTWGQIAREDPEQLERFNHHLHLWRIEGGEPPVQVRDRVLAAVREIAAAHEGETVAVFSHGCAIRILLAALQGYSLEELGQTPHGDNTAVSLIQAEGERMRVVFRDDNRHLTDPAFAAGDIAARKRANALEPGLYFLPICLPEQERLLTAAFRDAEPEPLRRGITLVGYLGKQPVGLVQLAAEAAEDRGWISRFWVREDCRRRGYGVQLLGQAVARFRPLGCRYLRTAAPKSREAMSFLKTHGFRPAGRNGDGWEILEKDISYHPEFLGK